MEHTHSMPFGPDKIGPACPKRIAGCYMHGAQSHAHDNGIANAAPMDIQQVFDTLGNVMDQTLLAEGMCRRKYKRTPCRGI